MTTTQTTKPTLLITGSEGSLANWIIKKINNEYNIIGIDNCLRYGITSKSRNYIFEQGELCDLKWVDSVFEKHKPDYVLHCAAQIYGVVGFHKYSADILAGNSTSTHSVLAAAIKHNIKKVAFLSSSMVYERATTFPLIESMVNDLPCPHTGYGLSKLVGERLILEYNKQYGLDYVIWRPFNIVTPFEPVDSEPGIAHVFTDFIKKIVLDRCESVEILGNGKQVRCFTWIDDIANIIAKCSWQPGTSQKTYNLGSETPTRIIDLAKLIWQRAGRTETFQSHFVVTSYNDDVITRIPSCDQARTLGWSHTKTVEELADICIKSVKTHNESILSNQ
jgi:nucleoside-diphosphate-sugar epimerase